MKKIIITLALFLALSPAMPAFAQWCVPPLDPQGILDGGLGGWHYWGRIIPSTVSKQLSTGNRK
jgi:hypothetical protein